jgi:DNA-binding transcriptional MerR regulator
MDAQEHKKTYSIGQLAREFGVSLRTLRFYEDRGLLIPHRKGTVRRYDEQHKTRLSMILKAKQLGFILAEIRGLIERWKEDTAHSLELPLTPEEIDRQILHLEEADDRVRHSGAHIEAQSKISQRLSGISNSVFPARQRKSSAACGVCF